MRKTTVFLITWLLIGIIAIGIGTSLFMSYMNDDKNNLSNISTWIAAGWSTNEVTGSSLQMRMFPSGFYYNSTSVVELTLRGYLNTNNSETVVFSFLSPFSIDAKQVGFDESNAPGSWSIYRIGTNASGVYYTTKITNCSYVECSDLIYTDVLLSFNNLPMRDNHGTYTVVVPFGGGYAPWLIHQMPNYTSFQNDLSHKISFKLGLDSSSDLLSAYPPFVGEGSFSYAGKGPVLQQYDFGKVGNSTLTVHFDNSTEVEANNLDLAFGLFLLGIGVPLAASIPLEMYRESSRSVRRERFDDFASGT